MRTKTILVRPDLPGNVADWLQSTSNIRDCNFDHGREGGNKGEPREASQMTTESGIKAL